MPLARSTCSTAASSTRRHWRGSAKRRPSASPSTRASAARTLPRHDADADVWRRPLAHRRQVWSRRRGTTVWQDGMKLELVETLARDARYALRGLARTPLFTIVALVTLAIGSGATTAV